MPNYLSITLLFLISVYSISHSIYVFKKGNHNPYLYKKEIQQTNKEKFVSFILTMIVYWSLYTLITNLKPSFTIIVEFILIISFSYTIFISFLNYLTYKKDRARQIIYHTLILFILNIVLFLLMVTLDYNSVIGQKYEKNRLDQIEQIAIEDPSLDGNTQSNINNYGLVAETNDSLFYIKDHAVCRADKDFGNQVVLFDQDSGEGKDTINVVSDWVFFRQGKEIKRMKNDGSYVDRISSGYSLQMHVVGNWIYFINLSDASKIYKMDIYVDTYVSKIINGMLYK